MLTPADEYDRTDEREAQYGACLLEIGGPVAIGWARADGTQPTSPMYYMLECERWFNANCLHGLIGSAAAKAAFIHWYDDYKRWILEARDEGRKRSSGNE